MLKPNCSLKCFWVFFERCNRQKQIRGLNLWPKGHNVVRRTFLCCDVLLLRFSWINKAKNVSWDNVKMAHLSNFYITTLKEEIAKLKQKIGSPIFVRKGDTSLDILNFPPFCNGRDLSRTQKHSRQKSFKSDMKNWRHFFTFVDPV